MFKSKKIKYFRIRKMPLFSQENLFIKYEGEQEQFLTSGKVDLEDFMEKQKPYYQKAIEERIERAKGWKERHQKYLNYFKKYE